MVDPLHGLRAISPAALTEENSDQREYAIHFSIDGYRYSFHAYPTPDGPDVSGKPGRYIMVWVQNPANINDGGVWLNFPSLEPGVHDINEMYVNTIDGHFSAAKGIPPVQMIIEQSGDGLLRATLQGHLESTQEPGKQVPFRAELAMRIPTPNP